MSLICLILLPRHQRDNLAAFEGLEELGHRSFRLRQRQAIGMGEILCYATDSVLAVAGCQYLLAIIIQQKDSLHLSPAGQPAQPPRRVA